MSIFWISDLSGIYRAISGPSLPLGEPDSPEDRTPPEHTGPHSHTGGAGLMVVY